MKPEIVKALAEKIGVEIFEINNYAVLRQSKIVTEYMVSLTNCSYRIVTLAN